jgi:hypothetical protein
MNNEKYNELIDRIKGIQPQMNDPQGFTTKTMQRIEFESNKKTPYALLRVITIASSIAASLLIGLFLFEHYSLPEKVNLNHSNYISINVNLPETEGLTSIAAFHHYLSIKKEKQKNYRTLYSNIINKHQIL